MNEFQIINSVLKGEAVVVDEKHFTYVERLFPQLGESPKIFLICKSIVSTINSAHRELTKITDESLEVTNHDVTGSPLKHSFGEESFNFTILSTKRNWAKDEENYMPLSRLRANTILNLCLECHNAKWSMPVFVLCDGSDKESTVLLGTFRESEWFSTMKVCVKGLVGSSEVHNSSSLMEEHLKLSSASEHEVIVVASSTYEFFGTNKNSVDWTENEKTNFEGYLGLELSWNTLSFLPPTRIISNHLVAEVAVGWKDSPLSDLWNQLLLLNEYLMILDTYQKKNLSSRYSVMPLMFPQSFSTPYIKKSEHLLENLNRLLSGDTDYENDDDDDDHSVRKDKRPFNTAAGFDDDALLRNNLNELSSRQNLDFTDHLWRLCIGASDYAQMTDCLHTVFEEIVNNHYKPQINGLQPTRLANLINDLTSQNATVPSLAGSLPLELVIDMGMEKMIRDYKYLLLSGNLADLHNMREKLSNVSTEDFNIDNYRTLLTAMARIHICLEFLLLVQNNLACRLDMSYAFFDYTMKWYTSNESPIKSFNDLIDNPIYTLKAPGSNAVLKEVAKALPNTWRATLTSCRQTRKSTTTTYYSLVPIFPPNIYNADDPIEGEESFHVTKVISSSYKIC
ncbi:protein zwilch homolog [Venturia canescens]|uniref:protein zwilch homolog n=1 Tax=Venturia canescens TaxID=32260 RepID=UPI001C9CABA0|nr:protein zwilch homolog [Venturia canescens]